MKRYNVKPTDMGSVYWEEEVQGDWVRVEDVQATLRNIRSLAKASACPDNVTEQVSLHLEDLELQELDGITLLEMLNQLTVIQHALGLHAELKQNKYMLNSLGLVIQNLTEYLKEDEE